ncbi:unnamed protein product [Thlaspi arvense]|uniref:non-specific serine/threonine protein kinase n=1 Tax=Thlaspi arvense TaxID=13288 RepID=A0AAU9T3V6_THLAR|nr:unnamed protein product [Thlaspi arvense]
MSDSGDSSGLHKLSTKSAVFGLNLYLVIAIISVFVLLISLLIFLFVCLNRVSRARRMRVKHSSGSIPLVSKEISEIKTVGKFLDCDDSKGKIGKEVVVVSGASKEASGGFDDLSVASSGDVGSEVMGWGRWYSLKDLEVATRGFSDENVIGEGGYGVVYRADFHDGSVAAVKNLLNNNRYSLLPSPGGIKLYVAVCLGRGQAEKEFKVEVEAIGKVRHKNLVGLMGYCADSAQRMLVYEYIDNGNLEQWLHGEVGPVSPLTWDIRMKIAIGTAKGLAYLHEGLEPKVVHRDVKSSNILLDRKWNPKVSDFGLAKLLGSETSYVTTRVMGTFGYVSPEYASTGMLNECSDVYSFGVLLMEIITGRSPVDYSRPPGEMNLVDWFKGMVASRRGEEVIDPKIKNPPPPPRALKRALLVCLRCIDLDSSKRPKMGQIIHMLEAEDFPFRPEHRSNQTNKNAHHHNVSGRPLKS